MKDIKPEMHDIGKLIERKNPTGKSRKHNFENYPFGETNLPCIQTNPIWEGIIEHHNNKDDKEYSHSDETLILSLADALATKASRHNVNDTASNYLVYKLWNPSKKVASDLSECLGFRADSIEWISEIVNFVNTNPTLEDYFKRFGKYLLLRAEDAKQGRNITSLFTHTKLTGMFYRLLFSHVPKMGNEFFNKSGKVEIREYVKKLRKSLKLQVVKLTIHFPQEILRIRDLNIFKALADVKNKILTDNPDNVIYAGFNEMVLIAPVNFDFEKYHSVFEKWNLWYEIKSSQQVLDELKPDPESAKHLEGSNFRNKNFYPSLNESFHPPICEICQSKHAEKKWEDTESGLTEDLCENCFSIRNMGSYFHQLEHWIKYEKTKLLWIKINLDYSQLVESLNTLYLEYIKSIKVNFESEDLQIKIPTVYEFLKDYSSFIDRFTQKITDTFSIEKCEKILDGFFIVKISKMTEIITCLRSFDQVIKQFFPVFINRPSPLKIGLICSNPKYSFMDAWRKLEKSENEVYVSILNKGEIKLKIGEIESFLSTRVKDRTMIHKLTMISEQSEDLAKILINDRNDRDSYYYRSVRDAVISFGFKNVLTYVKILED